MNTILTLVISAVFFMPQTDETTISQYKMDEGEVAFIDNGNKTATMYVGDEKGNPMQVVDYSSLRGYETRIVPPSDYSVVCDNGITYFATNDTYIVQKDSGTYRIVLTARADVQVARVDYESQNIDLTDISAYPEVTDDISGNVAIIYIKNKGNCKVRISNIVLTRVALGAVHGTNDLTRVQFMCKDRYGLFELGNLRYWAINYYNGNRGEDWSWYDAKHPVRVNDKPLYFDSNTRYSLHTEKSNTNLVLTAAGHTVMDVRATGNGKGGDRAFQVTDIKTERAGENIMNVKMTFAADIDNFDSSHLIVESSWSPTSNWERVESGDITIDGNVIMLWNQPFISTHTYVDTGNVHNVPVLYRLNYDGVISDVVKVIFKEDVYFEKGLYLKGDDDQVYKISVNGGVITATAVN